MQAIITKYLCPTNTRGARVKAECAALTVTLSYDHALNMEENHIAICAELCKRMHETNVEKYGSHDTIWAGKHAFGQLKSGEYVHVFITDNTVTNIVLPVHV